MSEFIEVAKIEEVKSGTMKVVSAGGAKSSWPGLEISTTPLIIAVPI